MVFETGRLLSRPRLHLTFKGQAYNRISGHNTVFCINGHSLWWKVIVSDLHMWVVEKKILFYILFFKEQWPPATIMKPDCIHIYSGCSHLSLDPPLIPEHLEPLYAYNMGGCWSSPSHLFCSDKVTSIFWTAWMLSDNWAVYLQTQQTHKWVQ